MRRWTRLGTLVAVAAVAVLLADGVFAQKTKGKTRSATTKALMKGLVGPNCSDLKKALDAKEVNWDDVVLKASLLNESGYLMMDDGRCPDGEWAKSSKALQAQSAVVLAKAEAKDLEGAKAAFGELTKTSCAVCHAAHKGK